MAIDTGQPTEAQQRTILGLSSATQRRVGRLQDMLDEYFDRNANVSKETIGASVPMHPNILDEIAENLEFINDQLDRIISFVTSDVLLKIH